MFITAACEMSVASDGAWRWNGGEQIAIMHTDAVVTTNAIERIMTAPDWVEFLHLRDRWHEERGITSSLTKIVTCPSYLRIIGMGEKAVSLILYQLEEEGDEPDFWFWALEAITGENPVPNADMGDMRAMAQAWLEWGMHH